MSCTITKVDKKIVINDKEISSQYPIINYKNINYLPLTYEVITNLGLTNKWDPAYGFEVTFGYVLTSDLDSDPHNTPEEALEWQKNRKEWYISTFQAHNYSF